MANKRMFSRKITDSDAFIDLPLSSQALYLHLNMQADDDGFVNCPNRIVRSIGAELKDLDALAKKRFILCFESGIIVIKHWHINNSIRKDTRKPTDYNSEFLQVILKKNGSYTEKKTTAKACDNAAPDDYVENSLHNRNETVTDSQRTRNETVTQYSLDKISLDKGSKDILSGAEKSAPDLPSEAPFISLDLVDKSEYLVYEKQISEWSCLYPAVDIKQELRKMKGWIIANPQKRKTRRGILRFIIGWLSNEQDKGGRTAGINQPHVIDEETQKMLDKGRR